MVSTLGITKPRALEEDGEHCAVMWNPPGNEPLPGQQSGRLTRRC